MFNMYVQGLRWQNGVGYHSRCLCCPVGLHSSGYSHSLNYMLNSFSWSARTVIPLLLAMLLAGVMLEIKTKSIGSEESIILRLYNA